MEERLAEFLNALRRYRLTITEGEADDPLPPLPEPPRFEPFGDATPGIFHRLQQMVDRLRAAGFTDPELGI